MFQPPVQRFLVPNKCSYKRVVSLVEHQSADEEGLNITYALVKGFRAALALYTHDSR
jgi:hypothetical protein